MDRNLYNSRFEREIEWHNTRAMLFDVHDNVVDIIELYCIVLLGMLDRFDKAEQLQSSVLEPMRRGEYADALRAVDDFVLSDDVMFKLFPQLIDRAEPGLQILNELAAEYELW